MAQQDLSPIKVEAADVDALPSFGSTLSHLLSNPPNTSPKRLTRSASRLGTPPSPVKRENVAEVPTTVSSTPQTPDGTASPGRVKRQSMSRSESPRKRRQADLGQFDGMKEVPDRLAEDLDILFCGFNPGVKSSELGYHYAHPSNRFYRILHDAGLTPYKLKPSESPGMPEMYKLGLTDLAQRCTARADQVPSLEFQAGATNLMAKLIRWKPVLCATLFMRLSHHEKDVADSGGISVCFVGMDVCRNFRKHFPVLKSSSGTNKSVKAETSAHPEEPARQTPGTSSVSPRKGKQSTSDVQLGLQNFLISLPIDGQDSRHIVRLVAIPSSSGLAAGYSDADRVYYLEEAKQIVEAIRAGRHTDSSDSIVIHAEDYMQARIAKLESGEWAYLDETVSQTPTKKVKAEIEPLRVKLEDQ